MSDVGISSLICKCLKLNSIVACDTYFGQQSVLALCSSNACYDDVAAEHSERKIHNGSNLQLLHIGGCKGELLISFHMNKDTYTDSYLNPIHILVCICVYNCISYMNRHTI